MTLPFSEKNATESFVTQEHKNVVRSTATEGEPNSTDYKRTVIVDHTGLKIYCVWETNLP